MFRSAASLIAKKTAIVAITGVAVIGGATFALAAGEGSPPADEQPPAISAIATLEDCATAGGTWVADPGSCTLAEPGPTAAEEDCKTASGTWNPDTESCTLADPAPTTTQEGCVAPSGTWDDEAKTCALPDPESAECDPATEACPEGEDVGGEDAVHPENHGKYVSAAAKSCKEAPAEGEPTYKNHGECVRAVAQGQEGKKTKPAHDGDAAESEETTESEDTTEVETEAQVETEAEIQEAPAPKAAAPAPKPTKEKPAAVQGGGNGGGGKAKKG